MWPSPCGSGSGGCGLDLVGVVGGCGLGLVCAVMVDVA